MTEWLKVPRLYLTILGILATGVLITHYADSAYYNNKLNSQASQDNNQEMIAYTDFNNLADQTIFEYANINPDCNQFKDYADRSQCQAYEFSKQALEKSGKPLGQILMESGP